MKKLSLLIAAMCCMLASSFATVHTVVVADFSFTPSSVTFPLGDTIKWIWSSGNHTTTNQTIPASAAPWNASINSTSTAFVYKPTQPGTYNYICTMHPSMMIATFTVTGTTGIAAAKPAPVFSMFPNPASHQVHLTFNQAEQPVSLSVTDMNGRLMSKSLYTTMTSTDINLDEMPNGLYFVTAQQGGSVYTAHLVVAH